MTTMTVSEARAALPEIIERVLAGEEVSLTRHGVPVAVVVRPDALRVRRAEAAVAAAAEISRVLEVGRQTRLSDRRVISAKRSRALLAASDESRSRG